MPWCVYPSGIRFSRRALLDSEIESDTLSGRFLNSSAILGVFLLVSHDEESLAFLFLFQTLFIPCVRGRRKKDDSFQGRRRETTSMDNDD